MSALVVVQSYGAEELKRAAHRYGFTALAISVLFHFSAIGCYYFVASHERTQALDGGNPKGPIVFVDVPPSILGNYTLPPRTDHTGSRPRGPQGIPVPVVEDPISVENPTDWNPGSGGGTDLSGDYNPPTGYSPGGEFPIDDNTPPPPWVAVEKEPLLVKSVLPVYPELALKAGIEGRVFVRIWVDKQGKPRQVEIVRSDSDILNNAAIEAAKQFVFTPACMNNGPVSVWVSFPFTFNIVGGK